MPPKVSIIILNWNQKHYTIPCIKSLLKSSYNDFEIILVDNGSEREDIQAIEEEFKNNEKIKIIKNKENKGCTGGRNIGIRNSSHESRYVVMVDNDTIAKKDWLKEMVEGIESDEKIKGMTCCYLPRNGEGRTLTLTGFNANYYNPSLVGKEFVPILYPPGYQLIFDKNLIKKPFDDDYFIYGGDTYLGWLIWLKGYKVMRKHSLNPNADFVHLEDHILQRRKTHFSAFLGTRNRLMNLFLFYEKKTLLKLTPLIIISQLFYILYEWKLIPARIKAYLWFIPNFKKVLEKRKKIQEQRKVPDKKIISVMSCKLADENLLKNKFFRYVLKFTNNLFCVYCKLVRLKAL